MLGRVAVLLLVGAVLIGCTDTQSIPIDESEQTDEPEQIEDDDSLVWHLDDDVELIARFNGDPGYYIRRADTEPELIIDQSARAEVETVSPEQIVFVSQGMDDTPFIAFPYQLIYYVDTGHVERQDIFTERKSVMFGGWTKKGRILTDIQSGDSYITFTFDTCEDMMGQMGGPVTHIPLAQIYWNEQRAELSIQFEGIEALQEIQTDSTVRVEQLGDGISVIVSWPEFMAYRAMYTFDSTPELTIVWEEIN